MNKFIKKNQKRILAVFSVALMLVFVVSLGTRGPGGPNRSEFVVAHLGKTPVTEQEMTEAKDEWSILMRTGVQTQESFGQQIKLPFAVLGPQLAMEIEQHPELYFLLKREAEDNGIRVSADEANAIWVNNLHRPANYLTAMDVQAIQGILEIQGEMSSLGQAVKISDPAWRKAAATELQNVRLNLVEFKAEDFDKAVPQPTPDQLKQQFEKYKNIAPRLPGNSSSTSSESSPSLGFGYLIPARVKLQYVTIPKSQVVASLQLTPEKSYEWKVKAAEYWNDHPAEFQAVPKPATKPAEAFGPSTQPAASQPTSTAADTRPTTQPFAEVSASIIEKLMADDVKKQNETIEKEIAAQLSTDWIAIRKADPVATQPASTQPAASEPAAASTALTQGTMARLQAIRADILAKYHVSIELHEVNDWQDLQKLSGLPGIGSAQTAEQNQFNLYALSFMGQPISVGGSPLQVWEPSQALTDSSENTYVFRLTAAQKAHAPSDMTALIPQLAADWKVEQTYDQAKQAAQKLLDSAKALGLAQATRTTGQTVITTGMFSPRVTARGIPNYPLTDSTAQADLGAAAQKLLTQATSADPRPDALAELPSIRRILVIELAGTQMPFELPMAQAQAGIIRRQRSMDVEALTGDWFTYDAVVSRMQYKSDQKS